MDCFKDNAVFVAFLDKVHDLQILIDGFHAISAVVSKRSAEKHQEDTFKT